MNTPEFVSMNSIVLIGCSMGFVAFVLIVVVIVVACMCQCNDRKLSDYETKLDQKYEKELNARLEAHTSEIRSLKTAQNEQKQEWNNVVSQLRSENNSLFIQYENLNREYLKIMTANAECKSQVTNLEFQLKLLAGENNKLKDESRSQMAEICNLRDKLASLQSKHDALQQEYDRLVQSRGMGMLFQQQQFQQEISMFRGKANAEGSPKTDSEENAS